MLTTGTKTTSDDRKSVQSETHASRSRTSTSETSYILAIREMIEGDRRLTVWEIATTSGYRRGVPKGYRKVSARWIRNLSTEDQKANRLVV
jgi:hypothetical protein